jgi:hypothetical protein
MVVKVAEAIHLARQDLLLSPPGLLQDVLFWGHEQWLLGRVERQDEKVICRAE